MPIEDDPFDESTVTKEAALCAFRKWRDVRTTNANPIVKISACTWTDWFVAYDYYGPKTQHDTPVGKPHLIKHRLEWLPNPVRLDKIHVVSPEMAVAIAFQDMFINMKQRDDF